MIKSPKGFTMLEVTLSIACLALILGMSIPAYRIFMIRNDLDVATNNIVQTMYRAQTLSRIADGDTSWGIHIATGSILLYKGVSYMSRDTTYDETTDMSSSISISGVTDIVFSKFTGYPGTTGTTTLTSTSNETRSIIINQKGMVDY